MKASDGLVEELRELCERFKAQREDARAAGAHANELLVAERRKSELLRKRLVGLVRAVEKTCDEYLGDPWCDELTEAVKAAKEF